MKNFKAKRKLSLSKNTVSKLNDNQLNGLKGGCTCTCLSPCANNPTVLCNTIK